MGTLELRELVKHYESAGEPVRAVDGVSLALGPGECVALYGPSGSGKTTLLMLAGAILRPDSGEVIWDGQPLSGLSERERARYRREQAGIVFQSFHLAGGASAVDNAAMKLPALGMTLGEAAEKAIPWLQRVGLGERLDHTPAQLSMGERQRVALARALANTPRLLLADEPTGNLDSKRSREVLGMMRELAAEQQMPVLLVTHDPLATSFVDRVYTLRDGRLSEGLDVDLPAAVAVASR
jgi:putative ABC transport system ATP-binding protein